MPEKWKPTGWEKAPPDTTTTPLFDLVPDPKPKDPVTDAFLEFHRENPQVYRLFRSFALQAKRKRDRFSARTILHRIRWETDVESDDPEGFKINNNWSPYYSRMFEREFPNWKGFFEGRGSAADEDLTGPELDDLIELAGPIVGTIRLTAEELEELTGEPVTA